MRILVLSAIISLIFTSCSKDRINASGDKITETRSTENFTGVSGSGATSIHITYGEEYKVVVRGSDNLVPRFKTTVAGNVLYLEYEQNINVHDDDIEVFVTLPEINKVTLSGSGEIDVKGRFPATAALSLSISGSGEVDVDGELTVDNANIDISGSGEADLEHVTCNNANIEISGSGDAKIKVLNTLKAKISGSGKVFYWGSPQVDSSISGSGKLVKL